MTAKTYSVLPGKVHTENDLWDDIIKMSLDCPITRHFVRKVECGQMTREIAALSLAKALIIDRKSLFDEVIRLQIRMPPPPIIVTVDQKNLDDVKSGMKDSPKSINLTLSENGRDFLDRILPNENHQK